MVDISSFSLATIIARAAPTAQNAADAKEAFSLVMEEPEKFRMSGNAVSRFDDASFKHILSSAFTASRDTDENISRSSIVIAGSYLLSALESDIDPRINIEAATRSLVTLAKLGSNDSVNIKEGFKKGLPSDVSYDLVFRLFDGSDISSETFGRISSFEAFPEPRDLDVEFANKVLSSSVKSLDGNLLAMNSAVAVQALGIKGAPDEVSRLFSALVRLSGDYSGKDDAEIPSSKEIAERLASDMVIQARAALILDEKRSAPDVFVKIRDAAMSSERMRQDLEFEAEGKFHLVSKGATLDLRHDLHSGALLSSSLKIDITLSASQASMFSQRLTAPLKESSRPIQKIIPSQDNSFSI